MKVVLKIGPQRAAWWQEHLSRLLPESEVYLADQDMNRNQIDYAVVWRPEPGWLKTFTNLKCILSVGAGIDHILCDPELPKDIPIIRTTSDDLNIRMREYVCLHVLRLHRRLVEVEAAQTARQWKQIIEPPAHKRRVGVMGLGNLGGDCARTLAGLGFDVVGWARSERQIDGVRVFSGDNGRAGFLEGVQILVCMLPLTPETEGILNKKLFLDLPKGASLINVARGQHLVEADLLSALESGQIGGATLDVFHEEPLPGNHPFWDHPKVLVTPHIASLIDPVAGGQRIADNILRFEAGEGIDDLVDLTRGY